MSFIRCFIAIELGAAARQSLAHVSNHLADQIDARAVRWVKPDSIHLTLRFLGDTETAKLIDIGDCLDQVASEFDSFELRLAELGCFPNPKRPRVIWIGVAGQVERLMALQQAVEDGLAAMGWEREGRRYHPHLTLGRVKGAGQVVEARLPWGREFEGEGFEATDVCLVQSDLRPDGAVYSNRHISSLNKVDS